MYLHIHIYVYKFCFSSGKDNQNQSITAGSLQSVGIRSWVCKRMWNRKLLQESHQARGPQRYGSSNLTSQIRALWSDHFDLLFNYILLPRCAENSNTAL